MAAVDVINKLHNAILCDLPYTFPTEKGYRVSPHGSMRGTLSPDVQFQINKY
jgi:hypothetical protein